ncbi:CBS domain-containing protein [Jeotgalibacillus sp. S-D1]|uniref:CBS domain-containing protein n=1 Tax=Jeotgalibacillus sp. S-D1 TaxID=2552189 RepID=UPI0026B2568D|nr:CBS domain-containing protein [Jeotgalibacillus sp. S-D1]
MNVRDVMTKDVVTCDKNDTIEQVASIMKEQDIGILPVLDQGKIIGMISDRDVVIRGVAEHQGKQIDQIMTHKVINVTPDTTSQEAAALMAEQQVRRLPVIENDKVIGMVSLGDLAVSTQSNDQAGDALTDISQP